MIRKQTDFNNEKQNLKIDPSSFEEVDDIGELKEVYHQVENTEHYRIGISVVSSKDDKQMHNLEFLLCVLPRNSKVKPQLLERALWISNVLLKKGYSVIHHDDGWLIYEKQVKRREIKSEIQFLKDLVSKFEEKQ